VVFFETSTGMSLSTPLGAPRLKAVDSLTGESLWQIDPQFRAAILVAQDAVLYRAVLGKNAEVTAYQADSGALLWKTQLPPRTNMPVSMYFADNKLFVSTANDRYFVLNAQGEIITERNQQAKIYLEMDGIIYLQGAAFKAIELASETERWQVHTDGYAFAPVFDTGTIFLRDEYSGLIYSIDQSTGKVNWIAEQEIYSNLFVDSKRVYFIDADGYLVSLDRDSGVKLSKVKFSVPFDLDNPRTRGINHCITGDPTNNVLVMSFYDNKQILAVKIMRP
jgi:outer membrane protein assembly factor BamB